MALVLVGGLVVALPVVAVGLGRRVRSPEQAVADAAPPEPSVITAEVLHQRLTDDVVFRADVVAGSSVDVSAIAAEGTAAVVSQVGRRVGDVVTEGDLLVAVAGRPVIALFGRVAAYRDLSPSAQGPDVVQLQQALSRLDLPTQPDAAGVFGSGTQRALQEVYSRVGYAPVVASEEADAQATEAARAVEAAQREFDSARAALAVASTPDASLTSEVGGVVRDAERVLDVARAVAAEAVAQSENAVELAATEVSSLESDATATDMELAEARSALADERATLDRVVVEQNAAVAGAQDALDRAVAEFVRVLQPPDAGEAQRAVAEAEASVAVARALYAIATAEAGIMLPRSEVLYVPEFPATVTASSAEVGSIAGGGADVDAGIDEAPSTEGASLMTVSAGGLALVGSVPTDARGLLRAGMDAHAYLESESEPVDAVISSVASRPTEADAGMQYRVEMLPKVPLRGDAVGMNVRVAVTTAATKSKVLAVPLAAVSSDARGRTRVTKVVGGEQVDVEVRAGLSAAGYVEVIPAGRGALRAGDRVAVGTDGSGG